MLAPQPRNRVVAAALDAAAAAHGLDPLLVRAVAFVESRYSTTAESRAGAVGLMQLMPKTAAALGVVDRRDPVQSAEGGATYLRRLVERFESWPRALAAYNWGEGRVSRRPAWGQWPVSVHRYVRRIYAAAGWPIPLAVRPTLIVGRPWKLGRV